MNIFITGGSTGIGLEIAKIYMNQGHTVAACSIQKEDEIQLPAGLLYYQVNVTKTEEIQKALDHFVSAQGPLDLVIANAGISMPKKNIPDFKLGRKVIETNLMGTLNTFEAALTFMVPQKKGHLVGVGSISGITGMPAMACYGSSKAAVMSLCESFASDLSQYNIDVTCVAPGFVLTDLTRKNPHKMPFVITPERAAKEIVYAIQKKLPLHVFPLPYKVLSTVLSLAPKKLYQLVMKKDLMGLRSRE